MYCVYKNISFADNILVYLRKPLDFLGTYKVMFTVSNWYDVLLFRFGLKRHVVLRPRNGKNSIINSKAEFVNFFNENPLIASSAYRKLNIRSDPRGVAFTFRGRRLRFTASSKLQRGNILRLIRENFYEEQYGMLDVRGKVVIDVGANIGDTAIYFALNGAKHVYAFEPFPYSYKLLLKNIRSNGLGSKITPINEGCGGVSSYISVSEDYESHGSSALRSSRKGKKVKVSRLSEIVERFGLDGAALKLDCEGCEYGIILDSDDATLNAFTEMAIEAHHGYLNIVRRLKGCGFDVKKSVPKLPINIRYGNENMILNVLHCKRIE